MGKHLVIWDNSISFLREVVDYCTTSIADLTNRGETNKTDIVKQRDYISNLEPDDRALELESMGRRVDQIRIDNRNIAELRQLQYSPYFFKIKTDINDIYISKYKSELSKRIVLFTAPIATLRYADVGGRYTIVNRKYTVEEKDGLLISNSQLLQIEHEDVDGSFYYDGKKYTKKSEQQQNIPVYKPVAQQKAETQEDTDTQTGPKKQGSPSPTPSTASKSLFIRKILNLPQTIFGQQRELKKKYVLGEIIDKMRKEQDEIMRAPINGITLIKGVAGSGKTNIAFHRIVYLIKQFPNNFKEDNIAVFCYNVALKKYLRTIIGELNISKVQIYSFDEWYRRLLLNCSDIQQIDYEDDPKYYQLKEKTVLAKIEKYVDHIMTSVSSTLENNSKFSHLIPKLGKFYNLRNIITLRDYAIANIPDGMDVAVKNEKKRGIDRDLEIIIKEHLCKKWSWSNPENFVFNGIKLLAGFYKFINIDELAKKHDSTIHKADSIILTHIIFYLSENLKLFPKFDHIVVDEVQDFSPLQMLLIQRLHNNSMTIVGDITQRIFEQGVIKWEDYGIPIKYVYELKLSHRSTLENILFANATISLNNQNTLASEVAKKGEKPYIQKGNNLPDTLKIVQRCINNIKISDPSSSIVVVYPKNDGLQYIVDSLKKEKIDAYIAKNKDWEFSEKINVTTFHQIKGLEFDYVIILGLNTFEKGRWTNKENVLYTVLTRAQKRCFIFYEKELPKMLQKVDPELYEHHV